MTVTTTKLKSGQYLVTASQGKGVDEAKFMATSPSKDEAYRKATRGCYQYILRRKTHG
jgi:hypothetical protein